ncbi:MAG: hypothetical protein H6834_10860 [Planctomycetes bacterium]|nr:hypothetical protein [Planctomycetota bacterium]
MRHPQWMVWFAAVALLAGTARAQYPSGACALQWTGAQGTVGAFCWGYSCQPDRVRVGPLESVQLLVRGDWNAPYVFLASTSATSCIRIPGVTGYLVIDAPLTIGWTGTLWQSSPILSCPPGFDIVPFTFPAGIPTNATLALQVLCLGANAQPGLTGAILAYAF